MNIPEFDFNGAIPGPKEMGVNNKGKLKQIIANGGAVSGYLDIMVSGKPSVLTKKMNSKAAKEVRPLGSRFFIDSIQKCKYEELESGEEKEVTMSEYVDMVPRGSALVSKKLEDSGFGTKGLIPGVLEDIISVNPANIFDAAKEANNARCIKVQGIVNEKQDDGSLNPDAKHPALKYLPEGVDWNHMQTLCKDPPKGLICETRYVKSKQSQPEPVPDSIIEGFSNIEPKRDYLRMGYILFLIVLFIVLYSMRNN